MSQVYSVLAYYWEHKQELEQAMQSDLDYAQTSRRNAPESPFVRRFKKEGILP